jgi:hypothetical protein
MPGSYKEAARLLHEITQSQQGFFTTKQAIRSGFAEKITDDPEPYLMFPKSMAELSDR